MSVVRDRVDAVGMGVIRLFATVVVALFTMACVVALFPVFVVALGADIRGDSELEAKCERIIDRVLRWPQP